MLLGYKLNEKIRLASPTHRTIKLVPEQKFANLIYKKFAKHTKARSKNLSTFDTPFIMFVNPKNL